MYFSDARHENRESLKFSPRQLCDFPLEQFMELKLNNEVSELILRITFFDDIPDLSLHCFRNVVNVLWLGHCLYLVFHHLDEIILEFAASEVCDDFLPFRRF